MVIHKESIKNGKNKTGNKRSLAISIIYLKDVPRATVAEMSIDGYAFSHLKFVPETVTIGAKAARKRGYKAANKKILDNREKHLMVDGVLSEHDGI